MMKVYSSTGNSFIIFISQLQLVLYGIIIYIYIYITHNVSIVKISELIFTLKQKKMRHFQTTDDVGNPVAIIFASVSLTLELSQFTPLYLIMQVNLKHNNDYSVYSICVYDARTCPWGFRNQAEAQIKHLHIVWLMLTPITIMHRISLYTYTFLCCVWWFCRVSVRGCRTSFCGRRLLRGPMSTMLTSHPSTLTIACKFVEFPRTPSPTTKYKQHFLLPNTKLRVSMTYIWLCVCSFLKLPTDIQYTQRRSLQHSQHNLEWHDE